jgi:hypothetical protein
MADDKNVWVQPRPVEWVYGVIGLVLLVRYRWFIDDAFVYFRYIDNFLYLQVGLVYNAGEYVEGFSSPLWLLLLLLLRALRLGFPAIVLGLAVVCFGLFFYGLVVLNRRLSPPGPIVNLPLALAACNYSVLTYFSGGLETALLQPLAVAFALFLLFPQSRVLQVAVAVSPLVRHELILPLALASFVVRKSPGVVKRVAAITLVALSGWLLFRLYYYADLLPNTFYLKDDWMVSRGLGYVHHTLATYWLYLPAALLLGLAGFARLRGFRFAGGPRWAMLMMALPVVLYVVKIGGAPVQYWYLAFPFCLALAATGGLVESAMSGVWGPVGTRWTPLLGLAMAALTLSLYPPQLSRHPLHGDVEVKVLQGTNDPQWHRNLMRKWPRDWQALMSPDHQLGLHGSTEPFSYSRIGAEGLCLRIYEQPDVRVVHLFGLTDPFLARVRVKANRPGHKRGLFVLARDLVGLRDHPRANERGGLARAVADGRAPSWVKANLEVLSVIERKVYNRHQLIENLGLALTPGLRIELDRATRARLREAQRDLSRRRSPAANR